MSVFQTELNFVARLASPSGNEGDFPVVAWELDDDGTGSGIVVMPNGVIARIDRLQHEGWTLINLELTRKERINVTGLMPV